MNVRPCNLEFDRTTWLSKSPHSKNDQMRQMSWAFIQLSLAFTASGQVGQRLLKIHVFQTKCLKCKAVGSRSQLRMDTLKTSCQRGCLSLGIWAYDCILFSTLYMHGVTLVTVVCQGYYVVKWMHKCRCAYKVSLLLGCLLATLPQLCNSAWYSVKW